MSEDFYFPLTWTPELVGRFWDYWSQRKDDIYFGKMFGPTVLQLAIRNGWLTEPVVDLGCGPGFMLEWLAKRGIECQGIDWSSESIIAATARCDQYSSFKGATTANGQTLPLADQHAGCVVLMEVLEHLLEDQLNPALAEIHRLLRPGGKLIITVPHDEDLAKSHVGCPNCGAVFHSVQHMRGLTVESLAKLISNADFRVQHIQSYNFGMLKAPRVSRVLRSLRDFASSRTLQRPHLLCVAEKR